MLVSIANVLDMDVSDVVTDKMGWVKTGEKIRDATKTGIPSGIIFEKKLFTFWWIFEVTFAFILGWRVKSKTISMICKKKGVSRKKAKAMLPEFRANFKPKIPEIFEIKTRFLNKNSCFMQLFCKNIANAYALDMAYNALRQFTTGYGKDISPSVEPDLIAKFYMRMPNGQSVRNRYRIVVDLIKKNLKPRGRILSIACGSAQPVLDVLSSRKSSVAFLTDISEESLRLAKNKALQMEVDEQVFTSRAFFRKAFKVLSGKGADVIEACGILDYFDDDATTKLIREALNHLKPGGCLITSNMNMTFWARSMFNVFNWHIIYRNPEEFVTLAKKAGAKSVEIYNEPWNIHPVYVVR